MSLLANGSRLREGWHYTSPGPPSAPKAFPHTTLTAGFDGLFVTAKKKRRVLRSKNPLKELSTMAKAVMRQSFAGCCGRAVFHYDVSGVAGGRSRRSPPPRSAGTAATGIGCISTTRHRVHAGQMGVSVYRLGPGFHCIPLALVDRISRKIRLSCCTRMYMHPNGQLPLYEWALGDVNPPVHAWAAGRVYKIDRRVRGTADRAFLEKVFHKLLLNSTWWVNRKDPDGANIFQVGSSPRQHRSL